MSDEMKKLLYLEHGTYNCYMGPLQCRCVICVQAHIDWVRRRNGQQAWVRKEIACQICGIQFLPRSSTRVLCGSIECRAEYNRRKSKAKYARKSASLWHPRTCEMCGETFSPGRPRQAKIPKKCLSCRKKRTSRVPLTERTCRTCGATFKAVSHFAYCQDICRLVGKKIVERIRKQRRREQGNCGAHGVEGFCQKCHLREFNKAATRRRAYRGEPIDVVGMAEAQKWKCSLCDGALSLKYQTGHHLSLTVDHTIPRSHGGTDDLANLTAAHRICNLRKGNRALGPEQLRLVG